MPKKVLIIDDDQYLCGKLKGTLGKNLGCECECVGRLVLAKNLLREYEYDMVILDRNLPDGDGLELVEKPIGLTRVSQYLVLSSWGELPDREKGLGTGVFEYLAKPFSQIELLEKVKRLFLAHGSLRDDYIKIDDDAILIPAKSMLVVDGHQKKLTKADLELMTFLARGGVMSYAQLRESVWNNDTKMTDNAIAIRVSRLRTKLGRHGAKLQTRYRFGYELQVAANAMIDTRMI